MLYLREPALHQQSPLLLKLILIRAQNHTRQQVYDLCPSTFIVKKRHANQQKVYAAFHWRDGVGILSNRLVPPTVMRMTPQHTR